MHADIHIEPHISHSARRYWNTWEAIDAHRGEGLHHKYQVGEEEFNHGALRVPNGVMQNSDQTVSMHLRAGSGGFRNMPQAPLSNDVQVIMQNFFRLQWMVPEQAEKILRDTAVQGPYEDFLIRPLHGRRIPQDLFGEEQRALCTATEKSSNSSGPTGPSCMEV